MDRHGLAEGASEPRRFGSGLDRAVDRRGDKSALPPGPDHEAAAGADQPGARLALPRIGRQAGAGPLGPPCLGGYAPAATGQEPSVSPQSPLAHDGCAT